MSKKKFVKGGWKYKQKNERFRYAKELWEKKAKKKYKIMMKHNNILCTNNLNYKDDFEKRIIEGIKKKNQPSDSSETNVQESMSRKEEMPRAIPYNDHFNVFDKQQKIAILRQQQILEEREKRRKEEEDKEKFARIQKEKRRQIYRDMTAKTRSGQPKMECIIRRLTSKFLERMS